MLSYDIFSQFKITVNINRIVLLMTLFTNNTIDYIICKFFCFFFSV